MDFLLDKLESKVEFFEAYDLKSLEKQIEEQIDKNKALLLDVRSVQHQVTFDPNRNRLLYTAVVHFQAKSSL
ncbi:YrzA family protein [Paenibacillus aurantius]|uniref:YrzA family protein n=1 Tax=Paenibacillus aurantius TaxID=2918900 RepID=A0AA96RC36_9BACL|nr:YrzA family protein [Paenibacillus aurantius]WNQ10105.1 YrzA family protein [Paenibacillus aurantius]